VFPDILFLHGLRGGVQPLVERYPVSRFIGERLPFIEPPGDTTILFLRALRGAPQSTGPEFTSVFLYGLSPVEVALLNRPLAGFVQPQVIVPASHIIRVTPADAPATPVNVLFQRPLISIAQPIEIFHVSDIINVTPADLFPPVFLPLVARQQPIEIIGLSHVINVLPADLAPSTPPIFFPLSGAQLPGEAFGVSRFIRIPFADIIIPVDVLFQHPLIAIVQDVVVVRPSRRVVVTPADIIAPPGIGAKHRRHWHRSGG
jgi:hypothetical protein